MLIISSPCKHGSCQDAINHFTCSCDSGYSGIQCEQGKVVNSMFIKWFRTAPINHILSLLIHLFIKPLLQQLQYTWPWHTVKFKYELLNPLWVHTQLCWSYLSLCVDQIIDFLSVAKFKTLGFKIRLL